jgi:uncharacterized protein YggE
MKKIWLVVIGLVVVASIFGLAGCSGGVNGTLQLQGNLDNQQQGIWVNGSGKVQAEPDIATLTLGVQAQADNAKDAQAQVSQAMDDVMTILKAQGIADKDIQTQYYTITQLTKYNQTTQQQDVTGYQVTNTVAATIRNIDSTGTVIDAVVASAGNLIRINNVAFDISDPTQYYAQARQKAVADAQARAQQIATASGVTLGKITYINESTSTPGPIYRTFAASDTAAPMPATSISPGQIDVTDNVQIVYSIGN